MLKAALGLVLVVLAAGEVLAGQNSLDGRWVLADRSCSSGHPPMDDFIIGRDHYEIRVTGRRFQSYLRQHHCEQWVEGTVTRDRRAIRFFVHRAHSTCPTQFPREYNYTYQLQDGYLSIYAGPFYQPGSCGHGEYLESVFSSQQQGPGQPPREEYPPEDQQPIERPLQ